MPDIEGNYFPPDMTMPSGEALIPTTVDLGAAKPEEKPAEVPAEEVIKPAEEPAQEPA